MGNARAWGKLQRDASDPKPRLSLVSHSLDVAAVAAALLQLPTTNRRLQALAGRPLDELDRQRLTVLAFFHDVGKAGAGFFSKALPPHRRLPRNQQSHTRAIAPLLCNDDEHYQALREAIHFWEFVAWGSAQEEVLNLWLAAVSHHGQPITLSELQGLSTSYVATWTTELEGYRPIDGLTELGNVARQTWPSAWSTAPRSYSVALQHAFAGLVSLADWIGSNTSSDFFPFAPDTGDAGRWPLAQARAAHALRAMGLDLSAAQAGLRARSPSFAELFEGNAPRPLQVAAAEHLNEALVVLEADTGSGKTEAALWRFKTLFERGDVDSLCFLLPTRVAATGIYERLSRFAAAAFPDPTERPPFVLAVPSDLRANGERGQRLPEGFEVLWPDEADVPPARYWAAENSKRYFAAGLVAGTIDQFLLSTLRTGHSHLRAFLSLRSLVVVDEVHASDAYMNKLLRHALQRHASAGGHALLLSATLTREARTALLRSGWPTLSEPPDDAPEEPYPSLAHVGGLRAVRAHGRNKSVQMECLGAVRDASAVAQRAEVGLRAGLRVLIVRNTVAQAIATQEALELVLGPAHPALFRCAGVVALHHGRYALPDRRALDQQVGQRFGTGAAMHTEPAVLVGTQTLEISVDCDCDLLITDLAPLDVLLQRIGRLHRHEARDPVRTDPGARCVLLTPLERDLSPLLRPGGARGLGIGANTAYPNLLMIEASWQAAVSQVCWQLPRQNRQLVEQGCASAPLLATAQLLGTNWLAHAHAQFGRASAQRAQAEPYVVDWNAEWDDLAAGELEGQARTRLGLDAVPLRLVEPWLSPFGHRLDRLDLPAWLMPVGSEAESFEAQANAGDELQLSVAGRSFAYGRWGLRRVA
jgi:CRISPR-associated endonuclease/helicase Cas3